MRRLVPLLLLAACLPARAEIYKWTDENGRVHFGDSAAGAGKPAEAVTPRLPKGSAASSSNRAPAGDGGVSASDTPAARPLDRMERQRRISEALEREEAERQAAARRQAEQKVHQADDCRRVREQLQNMEGRVVYTTGADGEPHYLDDAERKAYADKAAAYLQQNCQ